MIGLHTIYKLIDKTRNIKDTSTKLMAYRAILNLAYVGKGQIEESNATAATKRLCKGPWLKVIAEVNSTVNDLEELEAAEAAREDGCDLEYLIAEAEYMRDQEQGNWKNNAAFTGGEC